MLIVEDIFSKHNIRDGSNTISCDGIKALEKSMDPNTKFSCLSNHFNIISAINHNLQESPIQWF